MTDADAERLFREAVEFHRGGRLREAAARYAAARRLRPRDPLLLVNHGAALQSLGDAPGALAAFEAAERIDAANPDIAFNHGCALAALGRPALALAAFDRALALRADDPEVLVNRANSLLELRRSEEALASARAALARAPDAAPAIDAEARALRALRRTDEALASFERARRRAPRDPAIEFNRAAALLDRGRDEEALAGFERALALSPGRVDALVGCGHALKALGRLDAAIERYRAALATPAEPGARVHRDVALSQLAWLARETCDWDEAEAAERALLARVAEGDAVVDPFTVVNATDDRALQRIAADRFWSRLARPATEPARRARPAPGRRHRLGYLSGELNEHPTTRLMAGLFERHDRSRFELFAYSFSPRDGGPTSRRVERGFEHFTDVAALGDAELARRIAGDGLDLLVDLTGHIKGNRIGVLAERPAPVIAHYLGFPGTLGAGAADYLLADRFVIPPGNEADYAEAIAFLPDSYQVNDRDRSPVAAPPSRAASGLPDGAFVFCCFNNSFKLARPIFAAWMRILRAVPGSVLWLLADAGAANLRREAEARGIAGERLVFAPRAPPAEHLARCRLADLVLDTLPYNAHTTASDALWVGVPVVTCPGRSFAARVAGSLLHAVGVPELIAGSLDAYEALAIALAGDGPRLAALRARLDAARATAPLFDADRFRRHLERAYETMIEIERGGERPRSFAVAAAG